MNLFLDVRWMVVSSSFYRFCHDLFQKHFQVLYGPFFARQAYMFPFQPPDMNLKLDRDENPGTHFLVGPIAFMPFQDILFHTTTTI